MIYDKKTRVDWNEPNEEGALTLWFESVTPGMWNGRLMTEVGLNGLGYYRFAKGDVLLNESSPKVRDHGIWWVLGYSGVGSLAVARPEMRSTIRKVWLAEEMHHPSAEEERHYVKFAKGEL